MFDLSPGRPATNAMLTMPVLVEIIHDLLDTGGIINAQITRVSANRSQIEKSDCDHSASEFMYQAKADFRRHDRDATNFVFHHALGGFSSPARVVVSVAENGVIAQLPGASLETLDDFRKKRIFDIGDDNAQRAAVMRGEMARVHIANVAQLFDRGQDQAPRLRARLFPCYSGRWRRLRWKPQRLSQRHEWLRS